MITTTYDITTLQTAGFDLPLSLAVVAGVAVLYTLYLSLSPLLEEGELSSEEWSRMEDESLALLNKRDRVIAELKELEFEAAMNKIDDQDLSRLKGQYEREALKLIKALDDRAATYAEEIDSEVFATREAARARKALAEQSKHTHPEPGSNSEPQNHSTSEPVVNSTVEQTDD